MRGSFDSICAAVGVLLSVACGSSANSTTGHQEEILADPVFTVAFVSRLSAPQQEGGETVSVGIELRAEPSTASLTEPLTIVVQDRTGSGAGKATSGIDYVLPRNTTVRFAAGAGTGTQRTIEVKMPNDREREGVETLELELAVQSGPGLRGEPTTHTIPIEDNDRLVGVVDSSRDFLIGMESSTGSTWRTTHPGLIGGFDDIEGVAVHPVSHELYAVDQRRQQLVRLDKVTGATTVVGPTGFADLSGLTFDRTGNTLYAIDSRIIFSGTNTQNSRLVRLDPRTGWGAVIRELPYFEIGSLAFDTTNDKLYGVDELSRELIEIDLHGTEDRALGVDLEIERVETLTYDSERRVFWTIDTDELFQRELVAIRLEPFQMERVGIENFYKGELAFDPGTRQLFAVRGASLSIVDREQGTSELVGYSGITQVPALAFDPARGVLYASNFFADRLLTIDPATSQSVSGPDIGLASVDALARDDSDNAFYAVDRRPLTEAREIADELMRLDPTTWAVTSLGTIGVRMHALAAHEGVVYGSHGDSFYEVMPSFRLIGPLVGTDGKALDVRGLEFVNGTLYGADRSKRQLVSIELETATVTVVGSFGHYRRIESLAMDPTSGVVYAADAYSIPSELLQVDITTGRALPTGGAVGFTSIEALAADSANDVVYGIDNRFDELVRIDMNTGQGTSMGPIPFSDVNALAFDPDSRTLYGIDLDTDTLFTLEPAGVKSTAVAQLDQNRRIRSLALDTSTGTLYGVDTLSSSLLTIDRVSGAITEVGKVSLYIVGLAYDPVSDRLYGTHHSGATQKTVSIDKTTGDTVELSSQRFGRVHGLAWW